MISTSDLVPDIVPDLVPALVPDIINHDLWLITRLSDIINYHYESAIAGIDRDASVQQLVNNVDWKLAK